MHAWVLKMELWDYPLAAGVELNLLCVYCWILHVVHVFVERVELRLHSLDEMVWLHVLRV